MADLSLSLPVFIASPAEVSAEREVAEEVVLGAARDAAKRGLLLYPFRWEHDYFAASGQPQPPLTEQLRRAENVVVILWTRVGAGSRVELETALELAEHGEIDNVAIYFKTPQAGCASNDVQKLREALVASDRALCWEFASTNDFRRLFDHQLRLWLARWEGAPACCQYALENSSSMRGTDHVGDNRLLALERIFDLSTLAHVRPYLGATALQSYQRHGAEALRQRLNRGLLQEHDPWWMCHALPVEQMQEKWQPGRRGQPFASPAPLVIGSDGEVAFADAEWFSYFCAVGLADAICQGRLEAVALRPYWNPVHQYLSAYVRRENLSITQTLIRWLTNADGSTGALPVARNFAAYVLGMIGAVEAQDVLAETMRRDIGEDVQTYCITSLGKLRARRYLPRLVGMFQKESNQIRRLLLSQAVSNIVGFARFDL